MISISDNPVSQHYRDICKPSWEEQGFNVIDFEAVTPETVETENMNELEFWRIIRRDHNTREFTPTEKAIWWSHFVLWHKCLIRKKPIIVAEHDALLLKDLPKDLRPGKLKFAFLGTAKGRNPEGKFVIAPCTAYYLTPEMASELVKVRNKRWSTHRKGKPVTVGIYMNVDGYLMSEWMRIKEEGKMRVKDYKQYAKQIVDDEIGTTIEHGPKS